MFSGKKELQQCPFCIRYVADYLQVTVSNDDPHIKGVLVFSNEDAFNPVNLIKASTKNPYPCIGWTCLQCDALLHFFVI